METEPVFDMNSAEITTAQSAGVTHKRKRNPSDLQMSGERPSQTVRRTSIQSPGESMMDLAEDVHSHAHDLNDTAGNTFLDAQDVSGGHTEQTDEFDLAHLPHTHVPDDAYLQHDSREDSGDRNANIDTAAAALNQHYGISVPAYSDEQYINADGNEDSKVHESYAPATAPEAARHDEQADEVANDSAGAEESTIGPYVDNFKPKPKVGSDDWHKVRKDNHKEVERRRRNIINEGINDLATVIQCTEKNKGAILARARMHITKLEGERDANVNKWTMEKLITTQAIDELGKRLQRMWAEKEAWKQVARDAGLDVEELARTLTPVAGAEEARGQQAAPAAVAEVKGEATQVKPQTDVQAQAPAPLDV